MTAATRPAVRIVRRFAASPQRVFDAWLDPRIAARWLFRSPEGEPVGVEIDATVGGRFRIVAHRPDGDIVHVGEYRVIEPPAKLVFTFAVPQFSPQYDLVTVEIRPLGTGCELTLVNEMSPEIFAEWGEKTAEGWTGMLGGLDGLLEGGSAAGGDAARIVAPGSVRIERILPGPPERVWRYLTESELRRRWLAAGPMEPRAGGRVEHLFRHAELSPEPNPRRYAAFADAPAMAGSVTLWEPPRSLAYTWPGDGGTSEVRFDLAASGGDTLLVVTHVRLADRAVMVSVASGWGAHLGILDDVLAGRPPRGFWTEHDRLEALHGEAFA